MRRLFSDEELASAVKKADCLAGVCHILKLYKCGASYNVLNRNIVRLNLDTGHWESRQKRRIIRPIKEIIVQHSPYLGSTDALKKRLINASLLEYKCYNCSIVEWNGEKLSLQLDHINGDRYDNRLENLRLLCPNCHSQTSTYAGKRHKLDTKNQCIDCKTAVAKKSERCKSCAAKLQPTKINWPDFEELLKMLEQFSFAKVGRMLGVSDNAVRKRIKNHKKEKRES